MASSSRRRSEPGTLAAAASRGTGGAPRTGSRPFRRRRLARALLFLFLFSPAPAQEPAAPSTLPRGGEPEPLPLEHFPGRLHAFVWRNWGLVPDERLAAVVGAPVAELRHVAASLGLPAATAPDGEMLRRGYLTLIRRNWHLLPHEQLLALHGWSEERLAYTLREDDFLWIKLGRLKPRCPPLRHAPPGAAEEARAAAIRALVAAELGERWYDEPEPRFAFVKSLSAPPAAGETPAAPPRRGTGSSAGMSPRFLYSYFALYGDPLLEPEIDPFPDGYLARLAALGVDGVWLQGVLRSLTSSPLFPDDGRESGRRLAALRALVERAARHGIGVFVYLNEPRALPATYFEKHPELRGAAEEDAVALCTSVPAVQEFLRDGVASVFRAVPGLRGVFTITMSENFTSCWSHRNGAACPRCGRRPGAEVVAEVNRLIAEGARTGRADAEVIVWDWGWPDDWAGDIVARLPPAVRLQSVSEWSLPIERGGVRSELGEYSISAVGPGPRATRHWKLAAARGLPFGAKAQINNTWELAAVPYIPALDLVAQHCSGLRRSGATSLMLGWTLGGAPSPNLELASAFYAAEAPSPEAALRALAGRRFGAGAPRALAAWRAFSAAFAEFPLHGGVLYQGPQHLGPANLLHAAPTGYRSTMIGFPYDDLDGWRAVYPPEVFAAQLERVARGFREGLAELRAAAAASGEALAAEAGRDTGVAAACAIHFESAANQARFVMARRTLLAAGASEEKARARSTMRELAAREAELARELFRLASADSRLGYEASNHYFYLPRDLAEKVVSCRWLMEQALR